jgi:hypothetical protein
VVEKKLTGSLYTVTVIPSAGYLTEFAKDGVAGVCGNGFLDVYAYNSSSGKAEMYNWTPISNYSTTNNGDGTLTITFDSKASYDKVQKGDIFTCRLGDQAATGNVEIMNSTNVKLKDMALYGVSSALAIAVETTNGGSTSGIELERVHNTADAGRVIDQNTYNQYKTFESKYGVNLEVWQDDRGYYHGAPSRVGTADATHVKSVDEGLKITSCLFENMADDGTNHSAYSARLHSITDNGDGTTTIEYKNSLAQYLFTNNNQTRGWLCQPFKMGDKIYVYTNEGEIVCDTTVLSATQKNLSEQTCTVEGRQCTYSTYVVTVRTQDINWNALYSDGAGKTQSRYDLSDNDYNPTNKVFVDNMSQNSSGGIFDNVLVRNTRSRGFLIKNDGAVIKNCTFQNIAQTAVKLSNEIIWGESSVPRNTQILNCLFDHVGYDNKNYDVYYNAPIAVKIEVNGDEFNENGMCCNNIIIDGCKFTNNEQKYAISIMNAQQVTVKDCTFDDNTAEKHDGVAVWIKNAMNIDISNNVYNYAHTDDITKLIVSTETKNVFGSDVTDNDGKSLIPDNIQAE